MENKEIYLDFLKSHSFNSVEEKASFFAVSVPTIRKWESYEGSVPNHAVKIIELFNQQIKLLKTIDSLKFELSSNKQVVYDYLNSRNRLSSIVDS